MNINTYILFILYIHIIHRNTQIQYKQTCSCTQMFVLCGDRTYRPCKRKPAFNLIKIIELCFYDFDLLVNYCLFVSACNRTYMGDVGRTYELEVRRPREDHLPFVCHLNFTATGANYGDIIQVTI
jgi:hypothetical protein